MKKRDIGLTLVMAGFAFLMLSLIMTAPTIIWGISLGASIVLNVSGTAFLLSFLKTQKLKGNT